MSAISNFWDSPNEIVMAAGLEGPEENGVVLEFRLEPKFSDKPYPKEELFKHDLKNQKISVLTSIKTL